MFLHWVAALVWEIWGGCCCYPQGKLRHRPRQGGDWDQGWGLVTPGAGSAAGVWARAGLARGCRGEDARFAGRALGRVFPLPGEYPRGENLGSRWGARGGFGCCRGAGGGEGGGAAWRALIFYSGQFHSNGFPALVVRRGRHRRQSGESPIKPGWSGGRAERAAAAPGSAGAGTPRCRGVGARRSRGAAVRREPWPSRGGCAGEAGGSPPGGFLCATAAGAPRAWGAAEGPRCARRAARLSPALPAEQARLSGSANSNECP